MQLGGPIPEGPWAAAVRIGAEDERVALVVPWPATSDGKPAEKLAAPQGWPPGLVKVAFIMLAGATLMIQGRALASPETIT